jgi:hypothetical protein
MFTTLNASPVRWIAPAVLTWTALTGGAAYAGRLPVDTSTPATTVVAASVPVQTRASFEAQAATVRGAIADVHGLDQVPTQMPFEAQAASVRAVIADVHSLASVPTSMSSEAHAASVRAAIADLHSVDPAPTQMRSDAHAASVRATIADVHGLAANR